VFFIGGMIDFNNRFSGYFFPIRMKNRGGVSIKIAVMTMKGGQAKTTLAINLASRIAKARREVLLIDSDIQAMSPPLST
jgi:ATPases involved in chromosome partitioning